MSGPDSQGPRRLLARPSGGSPHLPSAATLGDVRLLPIAGVLLAALALTGAAPASSPIPVAAFHQIGQGPAGGTVWQGPIPYAGLPGYDRPTVVYVPPGLSGVRYPVVFLLHGFRGSPHEFTDGVDLLAFADRAIARGHLRPFIAVIPSAGPNAQYRGEWAGVWEDYLVRAVVPWAGSHLARVEEPPLQDDRRRPSRGGSFAGSAPASSSPAARGTGRPHGTRSASRPSWPSLGCTTRSSSRPVGTMVGSGAFSSQRAPVRVRSSGRRAA